MSGTTSLFYMCSFSLGNFTYLYRCRILDQYCCGHTCCFKQIPNESPSIFASWYFWSLILVVLIVFGCIIVSFVLSSLKQRHDIESWSLFAGTAFNNLATTVTGRHGIIAPQLHYFPKKKKKPDDHVEAHHDEGNINELRRESVTNMNMIVVSDLASTNSGNVAFGLPTISESQEEAPGFRERETKSAPLPPSERSADGERDIKKEPPNEWVEIQLSPLHPAYKSNWSGNEVEVRLAASTQGYFPPGFINS